MNVLERFIGQVLDDKYRIERLLGKGGMGAVYMAMHLGTERPVALKIIAPQFMRSGEFVERFRREARAAGRLRHPNVVDVTDFGFGYVGGERVAYLVMEYLDGCTLAEVLNEEKRLPLSWVADILEQVCSAVDEAHQQGIVHRDLKPDNIWLEPNRRGGYTVKVLDFGLAKLAERESDNDGSAAQSNPGALPTVEPESLRGTATAAAGLATAMQLDPEASEAATQVQTPVEEPQTLILSDAPVRDGWGDNGSEAETQLQTPASDTEMTQLQTPANNDDDEATVVMAPPGEPVNTPAAGGRQTVGHVPATYADDADGLTRVGSILGTPLYMSPEQCRGESLGARSDIYSIGVIAYQMLAGETPFRGDMASVIRQHIEDEPPPIREKYKKIPKKVAAVVMSALAKDPAARPQRALAFSNALRAHSEGSGPLLRRAFALLSEHFPTFLRATMLVYIPFFVLATIRVIKDVLVFNGMLTGTTAMVSNLFFGLLALPVSLVTNSVLLGVITRMTTQLFARPLHPLSVRAAFAALRRRVWPLIKTVLPINLLAMLGMAFCLIPGLWIMLNYTLTAPVVMMEDLSGRAALRRSKELTKRSRMTVAVILFLQVGTPALFAGLMSFTLLAILRAFKVEGGQQLSGALFEIVSFPLFLVFGALSAILTSLLYLKTRLAGGESLHETLMAFEEEESHGPARLWQERLRERSSLSTPSNRSGER